MNQTKPQTTKGQGASQNRVMDNVKRTGERVEVIGEDSSDKSRALILSQRGITSYVAKSELQKASVEPESARDMDEHDPLLAAYNDGDGDQRAQHSPLPWETGNNDKWVYTEGEQNPLAMLENIEDAKLIVRSVNNAEKLAEALRAWEYAGNEGGISMVDWFEVARKKTRAALAQWENNQ